MNPRIPLLVALAACGTSGTDAAKDSGQPTGYSGALELSVVQATESQAVWWVQWATDQPGRSWVEYGLTPDLGLTTPVSEESTGHDLALLGLKAQRTYHLRAVTELADGTQLASAPLTLDTAPTPPGMSAPALFHADPASRVAAGFVELSWIQADGSSWLAVVDGEGDAVWWRKGATGTMIVTSRPARNGADLLYAEWDLAQQDDVATLWRVGLDGRSASTTLLDKGHHDFYEWEDGTIGFIGFEVDPVGKIATDAIVESPEGTAATGETARVFSWLDDYPADPWMVCEHMGAGWPRDASFDEWTHSNSLLVHPDGEHYLLMSKFHDSVLKIRRDTGALVWQLNGLYGDITVYGANPWTAVGDTELFSHAHMSHAYDAPDGSGRLCLAVFDNGLHRVPELSRAVEVCVDEAALTAELTWMHDEPAGLVTPLMGDVRRLDEGWLIGWSGIGRVEEIDSTGTVLWGVGLEPGDSAGRVRYLPSLY